MLGLPFLKLDWFYDIVDLDQKNTWTAWLDSFWFSYSLDLDCELIKWINQDQGEMSLEKYEDFLELSVKQFVMQSSPSSLGQVMWGVWKMKF